MAALNFKKQFADLVEQGHKRQTIRAYRKDWRNPKPGDILYLYTGLGDQAPGQQDLSRPFPFDSRVCTLRKSLDTVSNLVRIPK